MTTLFVSLPMEVKLPEFQEFCSQFGPVRFCFLLKSNRQGIVKFAVAEDAQEALKAKTFNGKTVKVELARPKMESESHEGNKAKMAKYRLIVRNLSFNCTIDALNFAFSKYGNVVDCKMPVVSDKPRGFGFVEFSTREEGEAAIEAVNGTEIAGRMVAVDWALDKNTYDKMTGKTAASKEGDAKQDDAAGKPKKKIVIVDKENEIDRTLFIRNLSFDTTQETLEERFSHFGELVYALITLDRVTGISKGNGFVCFVNKEDAQKCLDAYYDAKALADATGPTQESMLKERNEKEKNDKKSSKEEKQEEIKSFIVPEVAETVLAENSEFYIDGRFVIVDVCVSKKAASDLNQSAKLKRRAEDKRNLYLMREGVIFPDTPAAAELSPEQLEKRVNSYSERKRLLQTNPNLFISKTRLSFRGINYKLTDVYLRKAARTAVINFWHEVESGSRKTLEQEVIDDELAEGRKPPSASRKIVIKQAKILLDKDRLDPVTKKPKSKGFGFVEFDSHADALACLRWMNNNPKAFAGVEEQSAQSADRKDSSKEKRPVVEFSVENKLVLKHRQERSAQSKKANKRKLEQEGDSATNKKPKVEESTEGGKKKKLSFKERMLKRKEMRMAKKLGKTVAGQDTGTQQPESVQNARPAAESKKPKSAKKVTSSKKAKASASVSEALPEKKPKRDHAETVESTDPAVMTKRKLKRAKKQADEKSFDSLITKRQSKLFGNGIADKIVSEIQARDSKWHS